MSSLQDETVNPWSCGSCGALMYNVEWENGTAYPVEGAPVACFGSPRYPRLCSMCYDMLQVIENSEYLCEVHREDQRRKDRYAEDVKRLRRNE